MRPSLRSLAAPLFCGALIAAAASAATPTASDEAAASPRGLMAPFARLVGGEWHIGPLRHVFEWGVGENTVIARSFDPEGKLASEARWFWHPGDGVVRGYSIDPAARSSPR